MICISINGQNRSIQADTRLSELLQQLNLAEQKIAIELNQRICPRSQFTEIKLDDGDQLEVIQAVGGG